MTRRPRWHDVVITLWILALAVVGIAAIWGETLYGLWTDQVEVEAGSEAADEAPAGPML